MTKQPTLDEITERVKHMVSKIESVEPERLMLDTMLFEKEDGLVAGLYFVELGFAIEEEFNIEVPDEAYETAFESISTVSSYIASRLGTSDKQLEATPTPPSPIEQEQAHRRTALPRQQAASMVGKKAHARQKTKSLATSSASAPQAWEFEHGRWSPTDDAIHQAYTENTFSLEKALRTLHYSPTPMLSLGRREQGFFAEVYEYEHEAVTSPTYEYYVRLFLGQKITGLYVTNLPSLLTLLGRFSAIIGGLQSSRTS